MSNAVQEITRLVQTLQADRQKHVTAIAEIDAVFSSLGINAQAPKRRGRKPGTKVNATPSATPSAAPTPAKTSGKKRRRSKSKDGLTGEQFLYKILADGAISTADVNGQWISSGRNGRADVLLGQLVSAGKLKRKQVAGVRGSNYSVA